ncbi:pleckstrin homology-like domain family B member 1 [Phyllopteryx taeniolatus]|uniref:pleckstrin homology-like domain family B member 1 n=1 Tax=Phyllopteryx taeniolatus TaxID=161469 RepID=UPI002AD25020|nr:pleckstrin homology-like domain family B member 1 [Phyllopteryx taeniolatus]
MPDLSTDKFMVNTDTNIKPLSCRTLRITDGEALEAGTKKFEDLEFQQLERESSLEEERETMSQQLLRERAEAKRKEKVSALENQANQLGLQASQECERLAKDRTITLQMRQKEEERLSDLEQRYHSLTGGKSFPKSSTAMREVFRSKLDSDPGQSPHQAKSGSTLQQGAATLGRNTSSKALF